VQGYNSTAHAPAMLEMFGVPYVGHDPLSVSILDNKHAFKREAMGAGLPTAPFSTWNMTRGPFRPDANRPFQTAFGNYAGPFIVKPVSGRASLHVHVADDRAALPELVDEIYKVTGNAILIEKYLSGREFCIAVAGPVTARGRRLARGSEPFTFAALERVLRKDEKIFTSMDVRPITADRFRPLDPRKDAHLLDRLHRIARDMFIAFELSSVVRLDLRSDEVGELYVLEANPKPDLKAPSDKVTSLISAGLAEAGMDYDDLILSLIADRLDFLLAHRRGSIGHIVELLEDRRPSGTDEPGPHEIIDKSLSALIATLEATRVGGQTALAAAAELQSLAQEVQDLAEPSRRKQSGQGGVR
jgi:D-alanine-D-alanine ligase